MSEVDEAIKLWLRGALDRHGGRNEHAKMVVKPTDYVEHRVV